MNIFQQVLELVSMETVYIHLTGQRPQGNKAICPFHKDTKPSMVIYPKGFKCYVCNAHGSTINFYSLCKGIKNGLGAIKLMNDDFCLGLNFDNKKINIERAKKYIDRRSEMDEFKEWEKCAFDEMSEAYKLASKALKQINYPENEGLTDYYCSLVSFLGDLDTWADILIYGTMDEKAHLRETLFNNGISYGNQRGN